MVPASRAPRRCSARWLLGLLLLPAVLYAATRTLAEIEDAAAQLQYAYYTGDAQALNAALTRMEGFQAQDELAGILAYQLAYGYWKLAETYASAVARQSPRPQARTLVIRAAQSCVRYAKQAYGAAPRLSEAYAFEAICSGLARDSEAAGAVACTRSKALGEALIRASASPRVRLIEARCAAGLAVLPAGGDAREPDLPEVPARAQPRSQASDSVVLERWRAVVASFDASVPSPPGEPDWGQAEALTQLGAAYLGRGESVAARDVLERALVLAPDYRVAQELLRSAAAQP